VLLLVQALVPVQASVPVLSLMAASRKTKVFDAGAGLKD